ncbi:polysaccharide deacetylase family protein [Acaryochloris sp. IP29b_bin.137]|uniref:polysaccharide deacetylase family protein n=1 Tax=Acaryochloris sp. IP29b_bin.137 TaxID=2969217 RepID=UPI002628A55A|nr:polysaccharide deacetylase family protein [Acaryochloris sp. IP29b_bin.137]
MAVYPFGRQINLTTPWGKNPPVERVTVPLDERHSSIHNAQPLKLAPNEPPSTCSRIPTRFQGQTIHGVQLPGYQKAIALTFDDGPWPNNTSTVLGILQQHHVKATFFVLGSNVAQYPHLLQQIATAGHAVGNHSWSHGYQDHSFELALTEIQQTTDIVEKYTGRKTVLFRPPGGFLDNGLVAQASIQKMVTVLWTIDDTYEGSVDLAVQNVIQNATSGGIVLMHDGGGNRDLMIEALPFVISELKKQDYQLVTIPQLLSLTETRVRSEDTINCKPHDHLN